MPWPEVRRQSLMARLGDRVHHTVGTDCDDPVDLFQRDLDRTESPGPIGRDRFDDVADESPILRSAGGKARRLVAAPHDTVGGPLDILDLVAVGDRLVAGEVKYPRTFSPEGRGDRK